MTYVGSRHREIADLVDDVRPAGVFVGLAYALPLCLLFWTAVGLTVWWLT